MRLWDRLNLVTRVSFVVILSVLCVAIGAAYQSSQYMVHKVQDGLIVQYNEQMDTLESVVLTTSFADGTTGRHLDLDRLTGVLSQLKYGADVSRLSFRDTSDAAAYSQDIAIPLSAPVFFSRWCGLEIISVNRPVIRDGVYYGLLSLSMSPNRVINQAWEHYQYLTLVMFLSLAIVLLSIWIVLRKALHTLLGLAEAGKTLTQGDYSVRVKISGSPELRTVLSTFNQMASSVQSTLASLQSNITERKKTDEHIQKLAHTMSLILNSAGEGIYGVDMDGKVTFINRAGARMLGYEAEELLGRQSHAVWHRHYPDGTPFPIEECGLNDALKKGFTSFAETTVFFKKDGAQIPVEYSTTPILEAGTLAGAVVFFSDRTSQLLEDKKHKGLEDQLRHSQKMEAVGTLAGGVAHDFNNILNVIIGYGSLLMNTIGSDQRSKEQLNEVLAAADRAAALTKRLLAFSRKQVADVAPLNVNELIRGLQKMLQRMISENVDIHLELAERPLMVLADSGQLEQVLMNLAVNAKDAMPEGGRLTISTGIRDIDDEYAAAYGYGKPGRYALITVADTGQGMDAETQKKIFEPFFTTKGIGEGTGLGLAISYGIIKQHSGYIKVYSEPGQGAEFKIFLPLSAEAEALVKKPAPLDSVQGGHETILVAEDEANLRQLSRIILESFGYRVITAEDGEDAITKFRENRDTIKLAMLDMIMPRKSGKEVSEVIRKENPETKMLFVSGYTMDMIKRKEIVEAGFDFMLKPVVPIDLLRKVREILDR